jgi:hypothetical protein
MAARAWRTSTSPDDDELFPGERIGHPLASKSRIIIRRMIFALLALGAGWLLFTQQAIWRPWLDAATSAVSSLSKDHQLPAPVASTLPPIGGGSEPPKPMSFAAQEAAPENRPQPAPVSPPAARIEAAVAAPDAEPSETASEPLPPPVIDPSDPYQKRALAAGLHPDLSRVLLARLSPTDYHNAGIAIKTALAETPDDGVYVWPRQRKPELALFKVHFVRGAAEGCRRYVVTVTKDGWLTTALPMEKCGAGLIARAGQGKTTDARGAKHQPR